MTKLGLFGRANLQLRCAAQCDIMYELYLAAVVELADTRDLKSLGAIHTGSIPVSGILRPELARCEFGALCVCRPGPPGKAWAWRPYARAIAGAFRRHAARPAPAPPESAALISRPTRSPKRSPTCHSPHVTRSSTPRAALPTPALYARVSGLLRNSRPLTHLPVARCRRCKLRHLRI